VASAAGWAAVVTVAAALGGRDGKDWAMRMAGDRDER
jgi:hypothetical protein